MSTARPYARHDEMFGELCALGDAMLEAALVAGQQEHGPQADAPVPAPSRTSDTWQTKVRRDPPVQAAWLAATVDDRWSAIAARMSATRGAGVFIPWIHLASLFQLTREEQQLLLVALLGTLDNHYLALVQSLDENAAGTSLPLGAAARLLGKGAAGRTTVQQALGSASALRHWQLVELDAGTRLVSLTGGFQLLPSIAAYLQAAASPAMRFGDALVPCQADTDLGDHLVPQQVLGRIEQFLARCGPDEPGHTSTVLHLQGPDARLLCSLCAATFARWGLGCVQLDGRQVRQSHLASRRSHDELVTRLRGLCRDALLCNRVLVLVHPQWLSAPESADAAAPGEEVEDLLSTALGVLFESQRYLAVINGPAARLAGLAHRHESHPVVPVLVRVPAPDAALRSRIWQRLSAAQGLVLAPALLGQLVNSYLFTEEQIRLALKDLASRNLLALPGQPVAEMLADACRDQNQAHQLAIAKEIKTRYCMEDIVLAPATRGWLQEVLQYAQHRHQVLEQWGFDARNENSKNLCVLFHGPSGTGKTMAASIVANELGLGLYKIDLASVLSKYIGETEKHLAQLFDQAESMNVVLFFDEAESLFSKRTETRDAHDRYANLQTGYLLQRIETYPGIVILSTNLMKNMDRAFTRRFKFMIEFPFPGVAERRRLWQNAFPDAVPRSDDIDFELLAERVSVSGGNINNIATRAAFHAAAEQQPLSLRHILAATEREYDKLGKVYAPADFAWDED